MKKIFTLLFASMLFSANLSFAQDTLAGWTFPASSADSLVDVAISTNASRFLSCEHGTFGEPSYYALAIDYTATGAAGGTDKCARTTAWANGEDSTYWMVKFRTPGYQDLKVSVKLKSDATAPGPREFSLQYKMPGSSSPWTTLVSAINVGSDWSTGTVSNISLPAECNNVNSNVSIRLISNTHLNINGDSLTANSSSLVDDIIITGTLITSTPEYAATKPIIYPNPSAGRVMMENLNGITEVRILDAAGRSIAVYHPSLQHTLVIEGLAHGLYYAHFISSDQQIASVSKFIVKD